ncbi:MAG: hypothetical protein CAK85_02970 [Spartobacteria bacterium AMD-G5]|nr:MAG: hypothetical protein CAK85_02970 [Spartobacteria bacterium AMD-G5]
MQNSQAGVFFSRLASAAAGSLGGLAILTFAPNSPWLSIPLFFAAAGWGTAFVARRRDPASAILFAMGIASMVAEGFVYPERDLPFGLAHMAALLAAAVVFVIAASSMGNDMATYLLGLAVCLGLIERGSRAIPRPRHRLPSSRRDLRRDGHNPTRARTPHVGLPRTHVHRHRWARHRQRRCVVHPTPP